MFNELITGGVSGLVGGVKDLIKVFKLSPADKKKFESGLAKLEYDTQKAMFSHAEKIAGYQSNVILAETNGESWLQRNWRPVLMLTIVFIVFNNYILFPYLNMFTDKVVPLELPVHLWSLMKIGVGGYVVGRSTEKIVKTIKTN